MWIVLETTRLGSPEPDPVSAGDIDMLQRESYRWLRTATWNCVLHRMCGVNFTSIAYASAIHDSAVLLMKMLNRIETSFSIPSVPPWQSSVSYVSVAVQFLC
jgi:hypothetical protein